MKRKIPVPFYFQYLSNDLIAKFINIRFPINLKYNEDLLDRVHSRYPLIEKGLIAIIIQQTFQAWRDLLILGHIFDIQSVFLKARLFFNKHTRSGVIYPQLKVQIHTPSKLKEIK